jgi:hypothetical protein
LVVYRTKGEDWDRFLVTLRGRHRELQEAGCLRVEVYRNRKHPDQWLMFQEWPSKDVFDSFADRQGPNLDREAGWVRWKDVSTWVDGFVWSRGGEPTAVVEPSLEEVDAAG